MIVGCLLYANALGLHSDRTTRLMRVKRRNFKFDCGHNALAGTLCKINFMLLTIQKTETKTRVGKGKKEDMMC